MKLAGLQKLTLLDYPGQLACTVFTSGCNMRCPFCQNADLVLPERYAGNELLEEDAFFSFLESRKGKLAGVAVTGGEPTLHADLPQFLGRIRDLGFLVKLDTNGTNPEMLKSIVEEGLVNYVAMDVKNAPYKYLYTCGLGAAEDPEADLSGQDSGRRRQESTDGLLNRVHRSMEYLLSGPVPYEFRTTVVDGLHTKEDIVCMAQWLQGAQAWYLQQFLPSENMVGMPADAQGGDPQALVQMTSPSADELRSMCEAARAYAASVQVRGI